MQSLTYVEIDIDRCSRSYGVAPCTASIPTTGDRKCMNAIGTCQDTANFNDTGVTVRFAINSSFLPEDIDCIPCIQSVDISPATLNPGVDLGKRASVKVVLSDHRDADTGPHGDPYLSTRSYNPYTQGTFFGKFRARHPYLRGRNLRVIRGEVGDAIGDMETRHFVIDSFDGPLPDGTFTITAKDPIKLADADRAQAPAPSTGYLSVGIDDNDTAITLLPAGIGNEEYPASGIASIGGKEIVTYTRSGDSITITARAQYGTEAASHDAESRFQVCLEFDGEDPAQIIYDLFSAASVDTAWMPLADWLVETGAYLARNFTALIAEPTSVVKLINELIEQAALSVWWDELNQKIRLQVLRAIPTDATSYGEEIYIQGSIQAKDQPESRASEVWTYYAQINPLRPVDEADNYRSLAVTADLESETNYGSPAIKKIFSRWIPAGGRATATHINARQIARYKDGTRRFNFDLMRDGVNEPRLGEGGNVEAWFIQDDTGAAASVPVQLTRVGPEAWGFKVECESFVFDLDADEEVGGERVIIIEVSENDLNIRDRYDDLYPTPASGDEIRLIINAGVEVGSSTTAIKGIDVGTWPTQTGTGNITSGSPIVSSLSFSTSGLVAGMQVVGTGIPSGARILTVDSSSQITLDANCTATTTGVSIVVGLILLTLEINGLGTAKGGDGGNAQHPPISAAVAGEAGGTAIYTRVPVRLEGTGAVRAPGGGGGGGGGITPFGGDGGGGGGGRGRANAPGGSAPTGPGLPGGTGTSSGAGDGGLNAAPGSGGTQSGGNGGDWATAGQAGIAGAGGSGAPGGAAGVAIDGDSYIDDAGTCTVQGTRMN